MTIVTGLLLACFVVIFTYHSCFLVFNKKNSKVWRKFISNRIIVKFCHTRFAIFFPLPSCLVSSLISWVISYIHNTGFIESIKNSTLSKVWSLNLTSVQNFHNFSTTHLLESFTMCFLVCLGFLFKALTSSFIKFYNFVAILELRCMEDCHSKFVISHDT